MSLQEQMLEGLFQTRTSVLRVAERLYTGTAYLPYRPSLRADPYPSYRQLFLSGRGLGPVGGAGGAVRPVATMRQFEVGNGCAGVALRGDVARVDDPSYDV